MSLLIKISVLAILQVLAITVTSRAGRSRIV
jgi:hypothetical protein